MSNEEIADVRNKNSALENNINAIKAVVSAVEGTLGPKGMDCMIVDEAGGFIVTNDGVTIMMEMDVSHPAAIMMINAAYAQQTQVGDGTTTMTVLAGQLLESSLYHIKRGVPVHQIIEGIGIGIAKTKEIIQSGRRSIAENDLEAFRAITRIAGRGHSDVVELVCEAASYFKREQMMDETFRFSDCIEGIEGVDNQVFQGVIVDRKPSNLWGVKTIENTKLLIIDDDLQPEGLDREALGTEGGFAQYIENKKVFEVWLKKLIELEIGAVFTDRRMDASAEQMLMDAGILIVSSVLNQQLVRLAEHTGARPIKKSALNKEKRDLDQYCGSAKSIVYDSRFEHIRVFHGGGKPMTTVIVSAATASVAQEKERIAKDAAASLQAAIRTGVVAGGGSTELACALQLEDIKKHVSTMAKYGVDCVIDCLKKPVYNIVKNAGYNPLEKQEMLMNAMMKSNNYNLGVNCENGEIEDMLLLGIMDPVMVKINALKNAQEICETILKINLIIKGRVANNIIN